MLLRWGCRGDVLGPLLDERDIGVLTAVMSLLLALVAATPEAYLPCVPKCVRLLERLTRSVDVPQEYTYYGIPSPWLQVKTMRVLQYFPALEDPAQRRALLEVLQRVLMGTDVVKNVNKNNAAHAVLFEALALVLHMDVDRDLMTQCVALLGKFIAVREPNIRYLGLENMARLAAVADMNSAIKRHQAHIIASLKDPDISIRRRALDLLYGMCDTSNAKDIVEELLKVQPRRHTPFRRPSSVPPALAPLVLRSPARLLTSVSVPGRSSWRAPTSGCGRSWRSRLPSWRRSTRPTSAGEAPRALALTHLFPPQGRAPRALCPPVRSAVLPVCCCAVR